MSWAAKLVSKEPPPKLYSAEEIASYTEQARLIYEASPARPHCPAWHQLSEVTQGVWIKRAFKESHGTTHTGAGRT